jgi:hypothetical protein
MSKDILDVLRGLLEHRTEDAGCYEFVLESWIEAAADEICRLRKRPASRAIITGACGDGWQPIVDISWPRIKAYAEHVGAESRFYDLSVSCDREPSWRKLVALADALVAHEEVLWVDADVVVQRRGADIFSALAPQEHWQGLICHETSEGSVPNCGVWLVTRPMLPFLVTAALDTEPHRWWEQRAIHKLIGYDGMPCRHTVETPLWRRTGWLDERWNAWAGSPRAALDDAFFFHAAGLGGEDRLATMRNFDARLP